MSSSATYRARWFVELAGGPGQWRATCQIFPPNLQGYKPFCPYTVDPEAGVWSAPALGRAKALVRRAGAHGEAVVVSASEVQPGIVAAMRHVVETLNEIGLRPTLEVEESPDVYLDRIYRGSARPGSADFPQVYVGGWVTDLRQRGVRHRMHRCQARRRPPRSGSPFALTRNRNGGLTALQRGIPGRGSRSTLDRHRFAAARAGTASSRREGACDVRVGRDGGPMQT